MTVAPPLSAGLITMFVFAESFFSALKSSGSVFFFLGRVGYAVLQTQLVHRDAVSRLLLPIGGLYLLLDWSLRQLVPLNGPLLVPSVAMI